LEPSLVKIALLTSCTELGRDGVGDYTLSLAHEMTRRGHSCQLLAIRDRYVDQVQEEFEESVRVLRLPASLDWPTRCLKVRTALDQFAPEWLFVQFVPYAYHDKGLFIEFGRRLPELARGFRTAVMFHEIWIGEYIGASLKETLVGTFQRKLLLNLIGRLNPEFLYTSNNGYQALLHQYGLTVVQLPMFGAIPPISERAGEWLYAQLRQVGLPIGVENRAQFHLFGIFGSLYPTWNYAPLFACLTRLAGEFGLPIALIAAGRTGPGRPLWENLSRRYADHVTFLHLEEQPVQHLSAFFNEIDWGISATPRNIVGKSSAIAAMLEHGLSVIVGDSGSPLKIRGRILPDSEPQILSLSADLPERLAQGRQKVKPHSRLGFVVDHVLSDFSSTPII
jgi:hypothetical protein